MAQFEVQLLLSEDPITTATVEVGAQQELSEEYFKLKAIQYIRELVWADGLHSADVLSITEIGEIVND